MSRYKIEKCDDSRLPIPADGSRFRYDEDPRFDKVIWAYGFRPFLLLSAGYTIAAIFLWASFQLGWLGIPETIPVAGWHAHEMIYGFAVAALCAFLLTSVPELADGTPVIGKRIAFLAALWLAGRLAMWFSGILPLFVVAAINLALLPILAYWTIPDIWRDRHQRHISLIPITPMLWAMQIIAFAGWMEVFENVSWYENIGVDDISMRALNAGLHIFLIAIVLVFGRVSMVLVPTALDEQNDDESEFRPMPPRRNLAVVTLMFFAIADFFAPDNAITGWIALAAAAAQFDRMADWHVGRVLLKPYVLALYLTTLWLGLGLTGLGFHALLDWDIFQSSRHALGVGAAGTALVAVFIIVALRHTCRDMIIGVPGVAAVLLVSVAAILRAGVPILYPDAYHSVAIGVAALAWSAAFGLWLYIYGPYLLAPRADGQPG